MACCPPCLPSSSDVTPRKSAGPRWWGEPSLPPSYRQEMPEHWESRAIEFMKSHDRQLEWDGMVVQLHSHQLASEFPLQHFHQVVIKPELEKPSWQDTLMLQGRPVYLQTVLTGGAVLLTLSLSASLTSATYCEMILYNHMKNVSAYSKC